MYSTPRFNRANVRNPILSLRSTQRLLELPPDQRRLLADLLSELRAEANTLAEVNWRRRKGLVAAYWRAVSTYGGHIARALRSARGISTSPAAETIHEHAAEH
jgi:hypothetical protein